MMDSSQQPQSNFAPFGDNSTSHPQSTTTTMPVSTNPAATTVTMAPIIDTTTIPVKSTTHIEGMDRLENQFSTDNNDDYAMMTDAERRMKEEELSFYSASENEHGDDNIWGLLSGVGGNIYEWYVQTLS